MLLDIGLPDVDGYKLAGQVRATHWGRGTVLVEVTGWGQQEDRERAVAAGFDQHLVKPISAETVEALLPSLARGTVPWNRGAPQPEALRYAHVECR